MPTLRTTEVQIDDQTFRSFLDLTPDGIVIIDAAGEIVAVNDEAEAMFGYAEEDLLGERIEALMPERLRGPHVAMVNTYLENPFVIHGAERIRDGHEIDLPALRKNGEEFFVEVSASPLQTPGGLLIVSVIRDVTEKRKIREKLQNYNRSLAAEVREQTRELQEKQAELLRSSRLASLGQLIAGVAHELNTPLGAVASASQTLTAVAEKLLAGAVDDGQTQRYRRILDDLTPTSEAALERLNKVVMSLRSYAGLDLSSSEAVDLQVSVSSTANIFATQFGDRIELQLDLADLPAVNGRSVDVNQALMNVLINSAEAIKGPGVIRIATREEEGYAVLEVADDGPGIASEDLPHVFEPGFTTKGVRVGAGLGLAIVERTFVDHGGSAEVESEPGEGTLVRMKLPL